MGNVLRRAAEFFQVAVEWLKKEFVAFLKEFAKQMENEMRYIQHEISMEFGIRARLVKVAFKTLVIRGVEFLVSMAKKDASYVVKLENTDSGLEYEYEADEEDVKLIL